MVGPGTERGPRPAARVSFVVLVIALLVVGVVATLWLSTQATADSYKLAQAQQDTAALSEQVQGMQQQVAQGNSPEALAARAQQLGMVAAGDPAHLVVGPDGSVTVVGTPSAVTAPPPPAPPPAAAVTRPPTASGPPPSRPPSTPSVPPTSTAPAAPASRAPAGG
jgi:cell division protein FtsB